MPKNKKSWIDKKTADTYLVIHRDQKFPLETEKKNSSGKKKDVEEHINCGIYFDDDYDYMQHLRDLNEVPTLEKVEKVAGAKVAESPGKPRLLNFLDDVPVGAKQFVDDVEEVDSEVEAALEGNFDFDDPENELNDDFVICANDGILPSTCSKSSNLSPRQRLRSFGEDSEDLNEEDEIDRMGSEKNEMRDYFNDETDEQMNDISCAKERTEEQRLIDEQFERLCDEYGEEHFTDAEDEGSSEALIDPDSHRMKELVEEAKRISTELVLSNDEVARKFVEEDSDEVKDQFEDIRIECSGPKKAKWDCESVLSAYSNIYNHPCLIKEPSRKQRLRSFLKKAEEDYTMDHDERKIAPSVARSRDETVEEKRIRKAVVKEQRRERRAEKKCNKLAFKEERRKLQTQQSGVSVKMTPIA